MVSAKPGEYQSTEAKKLRKAAAAVTDQHIRLNFLAQSAVLVAQNSNSEEDAFTKLSRNYAKQIRECLNADKVKVEPNWMRTFCKKCKQVFVNSRIPRFELSMTQRRVMQRKCKRCGFKTNYQVGEYLARNEKAKKASEHISINDLKVCDVNQK